MTRTIHDLSAIQTNLKMSFLRIAAKKQLKRSVSCVCFSCDIWQNLNPMVMGIKNQPSYRRLSRTSYAAKMKSDHYKELGLSRQATARQIKDAYYELSKKFHPDKNKSSSNEASTRFRNIAEAYEVLGNHTKKRRYDNGNKFQTSSNDPNL